jgi:hypothetical protein
MTMDQDEAMRKLVAHELSKCGEVGKVSEAMSMNQVGSSRQSAHDAIRQRIEFMRRDGVQKIKDADALEQLLAQVGHVRGDAESMLWRMAINL